MKYKKVEQASIQVGDYLHFVWCGYRHIVRFEEYGGPFDFVARIAVFSDGGRMSLTRNRYYEILEV
jgi:hypothetical protein